jgi:hypothetical protein
MMEREADQTSWSQRQPYRVRLPGWVAGDSMDAVGLGTVIQRATSAVGIKPCGACSQRADLLNRWVAFSPWSRR